MHFANGIWRHMVVQSKIFYQKFCVGIFNCKGSVTFCLELNLDFQCAFCKICSPVRLEYFLAQGNAMDIPWTHLLKCMSSQRWCATHPFGFPWFSWQRLVELIRLNLTKNFSSSVAAPRGGLGGGTHPPPPPVVAKIDFPIQLFVSCFSLKCLTVTNVTFYGKWQPSSVRKGAFSE